MREAFLTGVTSMTTEVTRFRVARSPQRTCLTSNPPPIRLADWLDGFNPPAEVAAARPGAAPAVDGWTDRLDFEGGASLADLPILNASGLDRLDRWLTCNGDAPIPTSLCAEMELIFDRSDLCADPEGDTRDDGESDPVSSSTSQGGTATGSFDDGDPLADSARQVAELLVIASYSGASANVQRQLQRAALILGLAHLLTSRRGPRRPRDVLWALRHRRVLLPNSLITKRQHPSILARRPGVSDLYVVRQEWNRYEAGEIAHIENALPREFRERVHRRVSETEETFGSETESTRTDEHDVQSTTRFEFSQETSNEAELSFHVEGQVDTSGQYGPTAVQTHLGGSLDFSRTDAEEHATRQATEVVDRAVLRIEERIRKERTVRTLSRIEETNTHRIDNDTSAAVSGIYRWVDKVVRLQKYRYADRFLLEFEVPEPGAYLRWLDGKDDDRGFVTALPTPLTLNGKEEAEGNRPLIPTDISEDPKSPGYYLSLAARYHAIGIEPSPAPKVVASGWLHIPALDPGQDKTSHDLWITPLSGSASGAGSAGAVEGQPIIIPPGYTARRGWSGWLSTWDQDDSVRPAWNSTGKESFDWVPPSAYVTVGDSQNVATDNHASARNLAVNSRSAVSKPIAGALSGRNTGTLPITVLASNYGLMSVQVHVECDRDPDGALLDWQMRTHGTIRAAYFEVLRAHQEEDAARKVRKGVTIEGRSPIENARIVRDELRRQVVEMLLGETLVGIDALTVDKDGRPKTLLESVVKTAPLVQFLEQVFEWENLTFVTYPYYWAKNSRWDTLQPISRVDTDYARFLRAGSARVILSVRPGYQAAVVYFIATGYPWTGGPAPLPEDPDYISIADEIEAQTGALESFTSGSSWEVRLPTTLVALESDLSLPVTNPAATIAAPQ